MKKWFFFVLISVLLQPAALAFESRDEMRGAYAALYSFPGDTPYVRDPQVRSPYEPGEISEGVLNEALDYLNFLRAVADLQPVEHSPIYDYQCQHGAVLLAALDYVDHYAPNPGDMEKNFYDSAYLATSSSNIAKFNWMRPSILREGIAYFARDDGDANLPVLGHRRWLLNPVMNATGFGLANSETGMSYVAMYAHDMGRPDARWSVVCWPAAGVFPVELMHGHLAWSVSLNPEVYDVAASRITVELREEKLGLSFFFDCETGEGDGFCGVSMENYGSGPCVIFRPDFDDTDFTDYEQNQEWTVTISGLVTADGAQTEMSYVTRMASLYPQDVANIELSQLEAELEPDETLMLSASVIPDYADDLSVEWSTDNPFVAVVDVSGRVTAVAPGECAITAASANGRSDVCRITVTE